jgi:hypothetical protein
MPLRSLPRANGRRRGGVEVQDVNIGIAFNVHQCLGSDELTFSGLPLASGRTRNIT